jgi:hypothetical protein
MDSNTGSRVAERGVKKKLALTESSGLPAEIEQPRRFRNHGLPSWPVRRFGITMTLLGKAAIRGA